VADYATLRALTSADLTDGAVITVTNDGIAGGFVVKTGTVTDNGGTLIVFTDDSNRYVERHFEGPVFASWFGSKEDWNGSTGTDDVITEQLAIDYCVANEKDLAKTGISLLSASLKYDRVVDGNSASVTVPGDAIVDDNGNDYYMKIIGGGYAVNTAITIFDTNLTNNDATLPCVQLLWFEKVKFEASVNTLAAYVMSPKFLRTCFSGCQFRKIKCLTSTTILTQSIYFINGCQARRWDGTFFHSKNANFDLRYDKGCLMEAGGDGFEVDFPVGTSFNGTIEGMKNFAIKYNGATALSITEGYYEANGRAVSGGLSIDGSSATGVDQNEMVTIEKNYFSGDDTDFSKPQVKWGDSVQSRSAGNHCTTVLHTFATNSRPTVTDDYARMALSTNEQKAITGITQANPAVVTIAGHGYVNGDTVSIVSVVGMTQVNDLQFTIANVTTNTFELSGIDSSAYTAYSSGGLAFSANHSIRNDIFAGLNIRADGQYLYGARLRGEFIGGEGGYARLRSIQNGVESSTGLDVDHEGTVRIDGRLRYDDPQTLTGAGAVNTTSAVTNIVTTGADALTLVDGQEGQIKYLAMKTDGGAGTLTPSNLANGTTITFDDVGDSALLLFTASAWHFVGGTATLA
jgi:hypothetical protein